NDARAIATALQAALERSKLTIGDRQLQMKLADGGVKFDPVTVDAADGKVEASATADLTSLTLNAACQLTTVVRPLPPPSVPVPGWHPPAPKSPLPPAIVLYS